MLSQYPREPEVYWGISLAYSEMGRFKDSEIAINKALELNPENWKYFFQKCRIFFLTHDFEKSRLYGYKVLELRPDFEIAHIILAQCHNFLMNPEKCYYHANEALKINPNSSGALMILGLYYFRINDKWKAKDYFLKSLQIDPRQSSTFHNYALLLSSSGEIDEAYNWMLEAVRMNPESKIIRKNFKYFFVQSHPINSPFKFIAKLNLNHALVLAVLIAFPFVIMFGTLVILGLISLYTKGNYTNIYDFVSFQIFPFSCNSIMLLISVYLLIVFLPRISYPVVYLHFLWVLKRGKFKTVKTKTEDRTKTVTFTRKEDINKGIALAETFRIDEAIKYFRNLLKKYPEDTDILTELAQCYYNAGKSGKAMNFTDKCYQKDTENYKANLLLGKICLHIDRDYNKAFDFLSKAFKLNNFDEEILVQYAQVNYLQKNIVEAVNILMKFYELDFDNPLADLLVAICSCHEKDLEEAEEYYLKSLDHELKFLPEKENYDFLIQELAKIKEGYDIIFQAYKSDPGNEQLRNNYFLAFKRNHFLYVNMIPWRRFKKRLSYKTRNILYTDSFLKYFVLVSMVVCIPYVVIYFQQFALIVLLLLLSVLIIEIYPYASNLIILKHFNRLKNL